MATKRFVALRPSDDHLVVMRSRVAVGEEPRGPIGTPTAKGSDALNPIGQRNTLQEFPKGATVGISVESHQEEELAVVLHHSPDKGHESREKVCLVYDHDIESRKCLLFEFIETEKSTARDAPPVMGDDVIILPIPGVTRMLENEHSHPQTCVPGLNTQDA
jgi:hypothetical protein